MPYSLPAGYEGDVCSPYHCLLFFLMMFCEGDFSFTVASGHFWFSYSICHGYRILADVGG